MFQAQYPGLNRLDQLLARKIESDLVFEITEKIPPVAVALNLEMEHRVNHRLIDDAEATVLMPLLVVHAVDAMALEVELKAEHVLGVLAAADVRHLVSQGPFLILCQRH